MDRASVWRRNKWEVPLERIAAATETFRAAAASRSRNMFAYDGERLLQGLIRMGIAVQINGKRQR